MPPAGSVGVWISSNAKNPKLHRVRRCEGLERVAAPQRIWFASLRILAEYDLARPCRTCALEEALKEVLAAEKTQPVFVTFTSQGCPTEDLRRFRFSVATESGKARLRRVAAAAGLGTVESELGPIAYGFVSHAGAQILKRNLRTLVRPEIAKLPPPETIEVLWGLLQANPPELGDVAVLLGDDEVDPFELAELITAR